MSDAYIDLSRDPVQQRLLRKALEVFREGRSGPVLQEMAREVLTGRVGLREATHIPAYAEAVIEGTQQFARRWERLSDAERHELAREGARQVRLEEGDLEGGPVGTGRRQP